MPDINYTGLDNAVTAIGNYETTTSTVPKVLRLVSCHYREIDGLAFGNKAWLAGRGATDTPESREVFRRHTMAAVLPLISAGLISEVAITVEPVVNGSVGVRIAFRDLTSGTTEALSIAPWGSGV
jgi:hypothetical protein